ncbi:MAG: hypothetical protein JRI77_14935 [Deltaproteobacteria bacterium]|nr:hypothetical protein [Deltaproteobacteria bacterium]
MTEFQQALNHLDKLQTTIYRIESLKICVVKSINLKTKKRGVYLECDLKNYCC